MRAWGADGCRGGWVICCFSSESGASFQLVKTISNFFDEKEFTELLFVDTPLGLSSKGWRQCDIELRKELGARRSSVFMAPVRDAVWAGDYKEACSINQKVTGKKISIQSWNICPPIREVDDLLQQRTVLRNHIRESHPEFLFQLLNDNPLRFKKKEKAGIDERIGILESRGIVVRDVVHQFFSKTKRKDVQMDDVLDSLILAYSAFLSKKSGILSIPKIPENDDFGLEMAIWYPKIKITQTIV